MSKTSKIPLGELKITSFTTDLSSAADQQKGGCNTNLYQCDTGNDYCEWFPNNTNPAVNCTACCSYLC